MVEGVCEMAHSRTLDMTHQSKLNMSVGIMGVNLSRACDIR